jgi:ubiquinone biosynthesis monooxygenase Coq6
MPYARERYIQNHIMLSATDKLHKIYSTEATPVVWARSVGVEILNELDTLKAAIMLNAGSKAHSEHAVSSPWNTVAAGVETLQNSVQVARAVSQGLQSVAAGALRQAADMLSGHRR